MFSGYLGRILGGLATLAGGAYLGYYAGTKLALSELETLGTAAIGGSAAGIGFAPYLIRAATRLGAATGYIAGSLVGLAYGIPARFYAGLKKIFSRKKKVQST